MLDCNYVVDSRRTKTYREEARAQFCLIFDFSLKTFSTKSEKTKMSTIEDLRVSGIPQSNLGGSNDETVLQKRYIGKETH